MQKNLKIATWAFALVALTVLGVFLVPSITFTQNDFSVAQTPDFINIAKSMINGAILYSDVADHKGLYLFLPFLLAQKISMKSTVPVYILEQIVFIIIVVSALMFYQNQTRDIESALKRTTIFTIIFVLFSWRGVSLLITEGFLCIALFWLFRYIDMVTNGKTFKWKDLLIWGVVIGFFMYHKYSVLMYFLPFFGVLIAELIKRRVRIKQTLFFLLHGVLGVLLASIVPLGYCAIHRNFDDMIEAMRGCVGENDFFKIFISVFIGIVFCVLAFLGQIWEKYKHRDTYILLATIALNFSTLSLENYLLIPFVVILFCVLQFERKISIPNVIGCIVVLLTLANALNALGTKIFYEPYVPNVREFAEKHGISNSNILYTNEDMGFGTWSAEPYKIPYQWIPSRYFKSEKGNQIMQRNLELIRNCDFEFVFFIMPYKTELKYIFDDTKLANEYYQICADIQHELDKNYYLIDERCPVYRIR